MINRPKYYSLVGIKAAKQLGKIEVQISSILIGYKINSTMHSPQKPSKETPSTPDNHSLATQSQLIDCFTAYQIPEFYQKIFINHIKLLPKSQTQTAMKEQVQSIINNTSLVQSFLKHSSQKAKIENHIRLTLTPHIQSQQIIDYSKIYSLLTRLRKANYKTAYFLHKIRQKHQNNQTQPRIYKLFANSLNTFKTQIQRSPLKEYLQWHQEYDPFYMHFSQIKQHQNEMHNQNVQELNQFTIEQSYTLLKMKKMLIKWMRTEENSQEHARDSTVGNKIKLPDIFNHKGNHKQTKDSPAQSKNLIRTPERFEQVQLLYKKQGKHSEEAFSSIKRHNKKSRNHQEPYLWKFDKAQQTQELLSQTEKNDYLPLRFARLHKRTQFNQSNTQQLYAERRNLHSEPHTFIGKIRRLKPSVDSKSNYQQISNSPTIQYDAKECIKSRNSPCASEISSFQQRQFNKPTSFPENSPLNTPNRSPKLHYQCEFQNITQPKLQLKNLYNIQIVPIISPPRANNHKQQSSSISPKQQILNKDSSFNTFPRNSNYSQQAGKKNFTQSQNQQSQINSFKINQTKGQQLKQYKTENLKPNPNPSIFGKNKESTSQKQSRNLSKSNNYENQPTLPNKINKSIQPTISHQQTISNTFSQSPKQEQQGQESPNSSKRARKIQNNSPQNKGQTQIQQTKVNASTQKINERPIYESQTYQNQKVSSSQTNGQSSSPQNSKSVSQNITNNRNSESILPSKLINSNQSQNRYHQASKQSPSFGHNTKIQAVSPQYSNPPAVSSRNQSEVLIETHKSSLSSDRNQPQEGNIQINNQSEGISMPHTEYKMTNSLPPAKQSKTQSLSSSTSYQKQTGKESLRYDPIPQANSQSYHEGPSSPTNKNYTQSRLSNASNEINQTAPAQNNTNQDPSYTFNPKQSNQYNHGKQQQEYYQQNNKQLNIQPAKQIKESSPQPISNIMRAQNAPQQYSQQPLANSQTINSNSNAMKYQGSPPYQPTQQMKSNQQYSSISPSNFNTLQKQEKITSNSQQSPPSLQSNQSQLPLQSNQSPPSLSPQPPIISIPTSQQSSLQNSQVLSNTASFPQQKKQIKLKPGKFTLESFKTFISNYQFHPKSNLGPELERIIKETELVQTYLTEFHINNLPATIALSSITPNNNFIVRLWSHSKYCDQTLSKALFKKYADYVEKLITNENIYCRNLETEATQAGFALRKTNLYMRERTTPSRIIESEFEPFASLECTHIVFPQTQKEDMLYSEEIENFTLTNALAADFFFEMTTEEIPASLQNIIKVTNDIPNLQALNKILSKQHFDNYQINPQLNAINIDLIRTQFLSQFKDAFVASDGHFKFHGNLVTKTEQKVICSIKLTKNNGRICFAKGFKTLDEVVKSLKEESQQKIQFVVPMFNKKLYGRYKRIQSQDQEAFYCNWDLTLYWQDEMQGLIKHDFSKHLNFGDSLFYVAIEIEGQLLYLVSVNKDDYIY